MMYTRDTQPFYRTVKHLNTQIKLISSGFPPTSIKPAYELESDSILAFVCFQGHLYVCQQVYLSTAKPRFIKIMVVRCGLEPVPCLYDFCWISFKLLPWTPMIG